MTVKQYLTPFISEVSFDPERSLSVFVCDTSSELDSLSALPGSLAYVKNTDGFYLLTDEDIWALLPGGSGEHPNLAAHEALGLVTDDDLNNHINAVDPHSGYELEANKGVAFGYASLNGSAKVPIIELPVGTTSLEVAAGNHNHDSVYAASGHNHNSLYSQLTHNHDSAYATIGHGHLQLHNEDHAARHASGGPDQITPASIGAASVGHTHAGSSVALAQVWAMR
jgi:hypothetical protein